MNTRTRDALKKAGLIVGIPFTLCAIGMAIIVVMTLKTKNPEFVKLLFYVPDYGFDIAMVLFFGAFAVCFFAFYSTRGAQSDDDAEYPKRQIEIDIAALREEIKDMRSEISRTLSSMQQAMRDYDDAIYADVKRISEKME